MHQKIALSLLLGMLFSVAAASAATVYTDDFDNGYSAWTSSGNVFQDNAPCIGPDCVRLKKNGTIWKTISTAGVSGIELTWNMAAAALENNEYCYVEVDTGSGYQVVASLTNGDDDSNFRGGTIALGPAADDNSALQVRFRVVANALGDYCYVDDFTLSSGGAGGGGGGGGARTVLTWTDLQNGQGPSSTVSMSHLAEPANADAPLHTFEGRLELLDEATSANWDVLKDSFNYDNVSTRQELPPFDFEFVQDGRDLIPAVRGNQSSTHPNWTFILGPGRAWSEADDNGDSRASFPFAIVQQAANCTNNGVMTFVYNDTTVSDVYYQITQETCLYFKFDMWGISDAVYHPGSVSGAGQIKADFQQELADRFPTKAISQLAIDYPGVDPNQMVAGVTPEHLTTYGFVVDGTNYVAGCDTRNGAYPYCSWMRLPSYSTSKSAFIGSVMLALGQEYGPWIQDLNIGDYLPEAASAPGDWSDVTFDNAVDMASGHYRFSSYFRDENSTKMDDFFLSQSYADRIDYALDWQRKTTPGTRWVYRTSDFFVLGRALQNYLVAQQGAGADIFDYLVDNVFEPLKIGPGAHTTLRTSDNGWTGQALAGYGLWWIHDDIAKLSELFHNGGVHDGTQIFEPSMLAATMFQDPSDLGLDAESNRTYNNGFWSALYPESLGGYGCEFRAPVMSGYGGIGIVLMPNGTTFYYVSDNDEFVQDEAMRESDKIRPMCPSP